MNIRVPAQSVHATTGAAHISHQQLQHGCSADDLRAESVLGPSDGIDDGCDSLHVAVFSDRREKIDGFQILLFRNASDALDDFRRVTRKLLFEQLEHAARMLERQIVSDIRRQSGRG